MELGQKQFLKERVAVLVASTLPTGRWVPAPEMRLLAGHQMCILHQANLKCKFDAGSW